MLGWEWLLAFRERVFPEMEGNGISPLFWAWAPVIMWKPTSAWDFYLLSLHLEGKSRPINFIPFKSADWGNQVRIFWFAYFSILISHVYGIIPLVWWWYGSAVCCELTPASQEAWSLVPNYFLAVGLPIIVWAVYSVYCEPIMSTKRFRVKKAGWIIVLKLMI